jgi:hypothetical protein
MQDNVAEISAQARFHEAPKLAGQAITGFLQEFSPAAGA